ncbi:hypothetical protein PUN28_003171 [Cardiocondyla obscurior]|uniref:Secreted protein n=1 Tax=Cardiocondyla obscurior TaxID=286306 RepID=A0AAW2GNA0_9HYME
MEFCVCLTYIQVSLQLHCTRHEVLRNYTRDEPFYLASRRSGRFFWSTEQAVARRTKTRYICSVNMNVLNTMRLIFP